MTAKYRISQKLTCQQYCGAGRVRVTMATGERAATYPRPLQTRVDSSAHPSDVAGQQQEPVSKMAATSNGRGPQDPQVLPQNTVTDRFKLLYPMVNEEETPLPRSWSSKDKYNYIGLSQNNLRVHYKGRTLFCEHWLWVGSIQCRHFDKLVYEVARGM